MKIKYYIIHQIFFFLAYIEQIHSIIVLPFKVSVIQEDDSKFDFSINDFFKDFFQLDYYSSLTLAQKGIRFSARISANNNTFFLSEEECKRQSINYVNNYLIFTKNTYKLSSSSSYKNISLFNNSLTNYKSGGIISEQFSFYNTTKLKCLPLSYDHYWDRDIIDTKINLNEIQIIIEEFSKKNMCCLVGIGKPKINSKESINFIKELKRTGAIDDYSYTFKFITNETGELVIGGLPHEYYNNSQLYSLYQFVKINSYSNNDYNLPWMISFNKIFLEDKNNIIFNIQNKVNSFIAPHLGFIIGTTEYKIIIMNIYFNPLINKGICILEKANNINNKLFDLKNDYFEIFSCDAYKLKDKYKNEFPKIIFQQNDFDYNFYFNFFHLFKKFKGNFYFLVIFPEEKYKNDKWYLGIPFIRRYQFIFNYDSKTIGFYNENKNNNSKSNSNFFISHLRLFLEIGVGIILIIFIILALIIGQKINKHRKKKAYELTDDNYDYFPKENNKQGNDLGIGV